VFDFSHEVVKRAVGILGSIGFFVFIACAEYRLLYLKQTTHDIKKQKEETTKA